LYTSHDATAVTDADLLIRHVNSAFTELTGYTPEEVTGRPIDILRPVHHDDDLPPTNISPLLRAQGQWHGRFRGIDKNGAQFLLALNAIAIHDENSDPNGYVFSFSSQTKDYGPHQPSLIDPLTQLPNRILLFDRLKQAIASTSRSDQLVAVILMDLDDFKTVNNRFGHPFGDRLLREIAQRLEQSLRASDTIVRAGPAHDSSRPEDTIARFGGDEFVIVAAGLPNMDTLEHITHRILDLVALPCEIDGREVSVTASLGVTVYPFDTVDMENLIRHADQAMYLAKELGRNRYHLFDALRDQQAHTRRQLLERLKLALADDELTLDYQPKVNLRSGKVMSVEALLRWNHPERGLIMPGEFLPHVEHDELILDIGEWVTRRALAQAAEWHSQGLKLGVSVNLAARQLQHAGFIDCVRNCLADYPGVPPGTLEFEILESSAIDNIARVNTVIKTCETLGVNFSLDDFGTGYASLTYLKEIPAEVLKIDQSFIRHIVDDSDALALVEGIIGLASAFRRVIVAEGVETAEQGVLLMHLGCDLVQGYGIARPMPAERIAAWVKAYRPDPQWSLWADTHWEMSDFPLLVAQYDHLKWIQRIALLIEGTSLPIPLAELADHQCRFGHWYYSHGTVRYGHLSEFCDLENIHQDIHKLGMEIVQEFQAGHTLQARHRFQDLLALKDLMLAKLGKLQMVVAKPH
jgi:PAS domain S-box-containing protein